MFDNTRYAELCEGIAETIDKYGHTVGRFGNEVDGYCLLGAGRKNHAADQTTAIALGAENAGAVVDLSDKELDKDSAIDLAISRAKYWRNLGDMGA